MLGPPTLDLIHAVGVPIQVIQVLALLQLKGAGMNASPESVRFGDDTMWIAFSDGRTVAVPLAWFPRLMDPVNQKWVRAQKGERIALKAPDTQPDPGSAHPGSTPNSVSY
jgi:hypothetical protein